MTLEDAAVRALLLAYAETITVATVPEDLTGGDGEHATTPSGHGHNHGGSGHAH